MRAEDRRLATGALFTDLYQLTMAQLYFRAGLHERPAQFDHFFRSYPGYDGHMAGYCVNAGLDWLLDWLEAARFGEAELACLRVQRGRAGDRLFADDFLAWLGAEDRFLDLRVRAVPEGRVVHPQTPVTVVQGPLAAAQILESPLLAILNYQILIATKAARIAAAGRGRPMIEFGMRRGHDTGVNAGARAALIGGADFTSNTGVSCALGYPPKGTHAHSMVQAFLALGEGELAAFRAYADVYPDDCLLLVDTVDTLESGIPNAIKVFEELRRRGHEPVGVRLDSGDLAYLALRAARMLDDAGFPDASIVLSNQLDEPTLVQILDQIEQEAGEHGLDADRLVGRLVYGVGTRLITSAGEAALDGVYKLVAIGDGGEGGGGTPGTGGPAAGGWIPALKLSETPAKILNPGDKSLWRIYDRRGRANADLVALVEEEDELRRADPLCLRHPTEHATSRELARQEISEMEPLQEEVLAGGRRVGAAAARGHDAVEAARERRRRDLERLDPGVRRIVNPHRYHVSLTQRLWDLKQELVARFGKDG